MLPRVVEQQKKLFPLDGNLFSSRSGKLAPPLPAGAMKQSRPMDLDDPLNKKKKLPKLQAGTNRMVVSTGPNDKDILVDYRKAIVYKDSNHCEEGLTLRNDAWNEVEVHHEGCYKKPEILEMFLKLVGHVDFYPIGYRCFKDHDTFLLRQCQRAMQTLFENGLMLKTTNDQIMLTVRLNVAEFITGQIYPSKNMHEFLTNRFKLAETTKSKLRMLDLGRIAQSREFGEVCIDLRNKAILNTFRNCLNKFKLEDIDGLSLANNKLENLNLFQNFHIYKIKEIDLRGNNIDKFETLRFLKNKHVVGIYLQGNPILEQPNVWSQLRSIYPSLARTDGQRIDENRGVEDVVTPETMHQFNFLKLNGNDWWHRLTIHHGERCAKKDILKTLFDMIPCAELYPVLYKENIHHDEFMFRNCNEFFEMLLKAGMYLDVGGEIIKVDVRTNQLDPNQLLMDPVAIIHDMICERFVDSVLDLSSFTVPDVHVQLSHTRILQSILQFAAKRFPQQIGVLRLRDNSIVSSMGLNALTWMTKLRELDLRNNELKSFDDLTYLPTTFVSHVRLNNNPLCESKEILSQVSYVSKIRILFPDLVQIDDNWFDQDTNSIYQQNYLCSTSAYCLIEEFLRHFFTLYDTGNRSKLVDMYTPYSLFTLSLNNSYRTGSFSANRYARYNSKSRNIAKMSDFGQAHNLVLQGPASIVRALTELPQSEHNMLSFNVDLKVHDEQMTCVTVSGTFRDMGSSLNENELLLGFTRTFVLVPTEVGVGVYGHSTEYRIVNDQLLICNLSVVKSNKASEMSIRGVCGQPMPTDEQPTSKDCEELVATFQEITKLRWRLAHKYLLTAGWNFQDALKLFSDNLDGRKFRPLDFIQ